MMAVLAELIKLVSTCVLPIFGSAVLLVALTVAGFLMTSCGPKGNQPNIEVIQDMMEQPALKAQDFHPHDREKSSMLVPPQGTWPKNRPAYLYKGKPVEAGQNLKNPYVGDAEVTALGQQHFTNFCMLCHGEKGDGKGNVAEAWKPYVIPSLLTDKIKNYPDGRIFHIITDGQGLMNTYIHQAPSEKDRWAIVNYVRKLQRGQ